MKPKEVRELRIDAEKLAELIKQLPEAKQEFINGYIQGLTDCKPDRKPA